MYEELRDDEDIATEAKASTQRTGLHQVTQEVHGVKKPVRRPTKSEIMGDTEYLKVNPKVLDCICAAVHKPFLEEEGLDRFASLNWQLRKYETRDLMELARNYDERNMTSRWHNRVIDLGDDVLATIFPLPHSKRKIRTQVACAPSKYFPNRKQKNGFLLNECKDKLIKERLQFLCEALHVKKAAPEIPVYIVKLLEETNEEKNWFGYFLHGFREELKKGKSRDKLLLGSHLQLILAAQAPSITEAEAASTEEEHMGSKDISFKSDEEKGETEVLTDDGQDLQSEGQVSRAGDLTPIKGEERDKILSMSTTSVSRACTPYQLKEGSSKSKSMDDFLKDKQGCDKCWKGQPVKDLWTTSVLPDKEKQNQRGSLSTEKKKLQGEIEQLVATHQKEKEDLKNVFQQLEKQLEAQVAQTKQKLLIERQMEWITMEVGKIRESKKKFAKDIEEVLKKHKEAEDKLAMAEELLNKAELEADRIERYEKLKASKAEPNAFRKEMDGKLKSCTEFRLKANRAELEAFQKKMGDEMNSFIELKLKTNRAQLEEFQKEMDNKMISFIEMKRKADKAALEIFQKERDEKLKSNTEKFQAGQEQKDHLDNEDIGMSHMLATWRGEPNKKSTPTPDSTSSSTATVETKRKACQMEFQTNVPPTAKRAKSQEQATPTLANLTNLEDGFSHAETGNQAQGIPVFVKSLSPDCNPRLPQEPAWASLMAPSIPCIDGNNARNSQIAYELGAISLLANSSSTAENPKLQQQ